MRNQSWLFGTIIWIIVLLNCGVTTVDIFCLVHSAVRFRGSCQLRWLGLGCVGRDYTHLIPDVCSCHALRILADAESGIWDVCYLPAPAPQPFSSNSLDFSAPDKAYSRNVRTSDTLRFGYEGILD